MRELNDLIVCGPASEVEKLVERIGTCDGGRGWKREPEIERALRDSGRARLGVFCFSWAGGSGLPPASLLLHRRGPEELAASSIVPAERKSLTDEESNGVLAHFDENVIRPLTEGLDVEAAIVSPHGSRLEWSLSPDAFSKLNWFVVMASNPADLTPDDRARWDDFWSQVYSDGSLVDDRYLGEWLVERGFTEDQVSSLIARKYAGILTAHHGGL